MSKWYGHSPQDLLSGLRTTAATTSLATERADQLGERAAAVAARSTPSPRESGGEHNYKGDP